ncbi:uncharacterized protein LY89DRAFT_377816 [Mollisia scopiformis]|uniref:Uncharacterized protein n=1 Tax=Mollisia scopiformis TaxID=149040 RepID=A0A194XMR7_MOLSC|nr:uncharacterized protein LY89DRAFT_377816 [Mollisia scopiformis]KUJ21555.1 hypothetical protein LY89DRAFT_377816 [Mollisia scopiformis]
MNYMSSIGTADTRLLKKTFTLNVLTIPTVGILCGEWTPILAAVIIKIALCMVHVLVQSVNQRARVRVPKPIARTITTNLGVLEGELLSSRGFSLTPTFFLRPKSGQTRHISPILTCSLPLIEQHSARNAFLSISIQV